MHLDPEVGDRLRIKNSARVLPLLVVLFGYVAFAPAMLATPGATSGRLGIEKSPASERTQKDQILRWDPPDTDAPIPSVSAEPPCSLPDVLAQAAARAQMLVSSLQNFNAQEKIQYEELDDFNNPVDSRIAHFDYLVDLDQRKGGLVVRETRTSGHAVVSLPDLMQDAGLPALALIFLPIYQGDYEMRCEGADHRDGQAAWVIHFQQRKDKPARTRSFRAPNAHYPGKLKGRAWISAESGDILRIETNLVEPIAMIHLRSNAVSLDYAPVNFPSRNVTLWLPQSAETFSDFGGSRYIVQHTYTDFQLFSVQTNQVIQAPPKPAQPPKE
jgi:hypothetical protein